MKSLTQLIILNRSSLFVLLALCAGLTVSKLAPLVPQQNSAKPLIAASPNSNLVVPQARQAFSQLPIGFEANRGQCAVAADFLARGPGYSLMLTATTATLAWQTPKMSSSAQGKDGALAKTASDHLSKRTEFSISGSLHMQLSGANPVARGRGHAALPGRSNYLLGPAAARWHTDIEQYRQIRYEGVYPGVDLVYYGTQQQLEYDFIVEPHANPQTIKLAFAEAEQISIDAAGDLVLRVAGGEVRQRKPVIYQEVNGQRQFIPGGYQLTGAHEVGFAVGAYDPAQPLVIDPVILYSTFLGGNLYDSGLAITLDAAGNIYLMGNTSSSNFPATPQALKQTSAPQQEDVFITKLNPTGTALIYSTYLGSNTGADEGAGFAVDTTGNVYLSGRTFSANFPVTANAAQPTFAGPGEAFVTKLNATGSALLYSTFLGGSGHDEGRDIALDTAGNFYVTGHTSSSNFPTTAGALQRTLGTPFGNAFIARYSTTGALTYATLYGADRFTFGKAIAADSMGNAFVAGDEAAAGNNFTENLFVLKLNPNGTQPLFKFTPTAASGNITSVEDLIRDSSGNLYVTGNTTGGLPTTSGAYQTTFRGRVDSYVLKLNDAGTLTYLTYLGGSEADSGSHLAVDSAGNIYVVGWTVSIDFPTLNAAQSRYAGGGLPFGDGFVTKLNTAGSALLYSTYLGEAGNDYVNDIAIDNIGNAFVIGGTDKPAFPVTPDAVRLSFSGQSDAFVVKLGEGPAGLINISAANYLRAAIAPEAIVSAFGPNLSLTTQSAVTSPLPTVLAGTSITVKDSAGSERMAPLFFVSPNQINYQIPPSTAIGTARVQVINVNGIRSEAIIYVASVAPALFTANANGQGVPAALILRVTPAGVQSYESVAVLDPSTNRFVPRPLNFGQDDLYLILYGSGLRFRSQLSAVQVQLDFNTEAALFAGKQGSLVGVDQINVRLPRTLVGRGEVGVMVLADGNRSNEVRIRFQ